MLVFFIGITGIFFMGIATNNETDGIEYRQTGVQLGHWRDGLPWKPERGLPNMAGLLCKTAQAN